MSARHALEKRSGRLFSAGHEVREQDETRRLTSFTRLSYTCRNAHQRNKERKRKERKGKCEGGMTVEDSDCDLTISSSPSAGRGTTLSAATSRVGLAERGRETHGGRSSSGNLKPQGPGQGRRTCTRQVRDAT